MAFNLGHQNTHSISRTSYVNSSDIFIVRACAHEEALDLLAIGGENRVEILQREDLSAPIPSFKNIASFYTGCQVNAIAWSPRTISPLVSPSDWFLELVVAGSDNNLRLLLFSPAQEEAGNEPEVRDFGSGLSGHHGRINDISFCSAETYKTNVASIGDDGLILWNLYPPNDGDEGVLSLDGANSRRSQPSASYRGTGTQEPQGDDGNDTEEENDTHETGHIDHRSRGQFQPVNANAALSSRSPQPPQPTAYTITFPHPLHSISAHANSAKQFMVSDSRGTVYIVDWTELDPAKPAGWRGHRVVELTDPRALTDGLTGMRGGWSGGASWKPNDVNMIGATYGTRWCVWDLRKLQGGKPFAIGEGHPQGGHRFRWCPTDPHLFAISTQSPIPGAIMKVYHTAYPHSPRLYSILPAPHRVRDFDWLCGPHDATRAWMAVAVGKKLVFVAGGDPLPNEGYGYHSLSPQP